MSDQYSNEPMLDMFIFETLQLIEQLEQSILVGEETSSFTQSNINEIFRIMHTIKSSSAMMMFENISLLTHSIEDLFYYMREEKPKEIDYSTLSDIVLESLDFIKLEIEKIKNGNSQDGDATFLIDSIKSFLSNLKNDNIASYIIDKKDKKHESTNKSNPDLKKDNSTPKNTFKAMVHFEEGCEMENVRAFSIIHKLKDITTDLIYMPEDIIDNDNSANIIKKDGFKIYFKTDRSYEEMHEFFMQTIFLEDLELIEVKSDESVKQLSKTDLSKNEGKTINSKESNNIHTTTAQHNIISVNVKKLDKLMDLMGEMVIAEAMVIQNPDLKGLELDNFKKAAHQLHKITGEIQEMVMSIRMVPVALTFQKMYRIVRDMCKKLGKEVDLKLIGEETEVDKNIIEHISDPLMHLIRNSIDHGIESSSERQANGKPQKGTITLEAKNAGSDVLIIVKDDGKGLNKEQILQRAKENKLLHKPENEMSDKEIYNLILIPGFSTKNKVSEFSGRGVGMDVVAKNIQTIGGSISVDSIEDTGTTITLKIPLTLAIIDGMNIKVGNSYYTIPINSIRESFRPAENDIIVDPDGNEMIVVRGHCYQIQRLHEYYRINTNITEFSKGILIMVETDGKTLCLFADELLGQQQVVVKALPNYIKNTRVIKGLSGCTLLGDGSISLILDIRRLSD